jgi:TonB family protein
MNRYPALIAKVSLFLALSLSQALAQQSEVRLSILPDAKFINDEERKELTRKLNGSAETTLIFNNPDGIPTLIKEANVKSVRRDEQHWTKNGESVLSDYVMQASLTLENRSARRAKLVTVQFTNVETKQVFYVSRVVGEKDERFSIPFMVTTGNPSSLIMEIVKVRFEDGSVWGDYPFPQEGAKQDYKTASEDAEIRAKALAAVDNRPKLLNRLQPLYTEEARKNKVEGSVRLRFLIGADGSVKQVIVTNALPDGLSEEAIRIAYQMKFEPATKGGVAVEFWNVMKVDFNIR